MNPMVGISREHVKFPELIAAGGVVGTLGVWVADHIDAINAALRSYTLLAGAIGGTFAALFWIRRWFSKRKDL